jgi:Flp pilus assembly protein TadD
MSIKLVMTLGGAAIAALSPAAAVADTGPAASNALYATEAISGGHYARAEKVLRPVSRADADDPARLINLATVYLGTGRLAMARHALERVSKLPDETLTLRGGASFSSRRIAATLLNRLPSAG